MKHRFTKQLPAQWGMKRVLTVLTVLLCLPISVFADVEYITITTSKGTKDKNSWQYYSENSDYRKKEVYVTLASDIIIDNDIDNWENFTGTLDGNGHTITLNYNKIDRAPLRNTIGKTTIKNVYVTGKITNTLGEISYDEAAPLVRYVNEGTLTVENCWSDVEFTIVDNSIKKFNSAYNGGFVASIEGSGNAVFKNCLSTASFLTDYHWIDVGGFVGRLKDGCTVSFANCLSYITIDNSTDWVSTRTSESDNVGPFVGSDSGGSGQTANAICLENTRYTNERYYSQMLSADEFTTGRIVFVLDFNETDTWAQTLGTDKHPKLKKFSPNSKKVAWLGYDVEWNGNGKTWDTFFSPFEVTLPDDTQIYEVTGTNDEKVVLTATTEYKNKAVLLYNKSGLGKISLPTGYYNPPEFDGYLKGTSTSVTTTSSQYALAQPTEKSYSFDKGAGNTVDAWHCYLKGSDLTLDRYYVYKDFENKDKNLIKNGDFADDLDNWTKAGIYSAICTDEDDPARGKFWRTGRSLGSLTQTVNLLDYFNEDELSESKYASMACDISAPWGYTKIIVSYQFLDSQGNELKTVSLIESSVSDEFEWKNISNTTDVPAGTRSVKVTIAGQDNKTWTGQYGPGFDNVWLSIANSETPAKKKVTVVASPEVGGTVTGAGEYITGSRVTLTAIPNDGYTFKYWNNDTKLTDDDYTFTVVSDITVTAVFEKGTGVSDIKSDFNTNGKIYNLKGQEVQATEKGQIYIQNGKKFVAK